MGLEITGVTTPVAPLDATAETPVDEARALADAVARTARQQLRLDVMRERFNAAQERRAEQLREMNVLRDMALEQAKKDDEVLKKFIAMI